MSSPNLAAPNPDVQIAALWCCYRTAQRDPELINRQRERRHLHLIACACGNPAIRVLARGMLRALMRQTDPATTPPIEAPCA